VCLDGLPRHMRFKELGACPFTSTVNADGERET